MPLPVTLKIKDSVGQGGKNDLQDILAVKNRLADLGFPVARDSIVNPDTVAIIKLFQCKESGKKLTKQLRGLK